MDDQPRKSKNPKRTQVHQLVRTDDNQSRRGHERHQKNLTRTYGMANSAICLKSDLIGLMAVGYISKLQTKTNFYEHCRYGKQTRSPHSLHYEIVHQPLELVHTNICGPMPEKSLGRSWYFITFVNDYARKVWAY